MRSNEGQEIAGKNNDGSFKALCIGNKNEINCDAISYFVLYSCIKTCKRMKDRIKMLYLAGKRIALRDWQREDIERYRYWLQPGRRWQDFDGPYYPRADGAELEERITKLSESLDHDKGTELRTDLVIADRTSNELQGRVSWYWQSEETYWLSLGIALYDPASWGQGIGYEALGLWSEYLLTAQPLLARLDIRTWSGNIGMMRLAEKLGYREEARFRKARIVQGQYYDGMGYGILREEWQARYPQGFAATLQEN